MLTIMTLMLGASLVLVSGSHAIAAEQIKF